MITMNLNNPSSRPPLPRNEQRDALVLSPLAFLKLQFFLHVGDTAVGGFGVSGSENLLYIDDFVTVRQTASPVGVSLEAGAVAEHLAAMQELGYCPDQCARIWILTHPGLWAQPSRADERTFAEACDGCDWSLLFILDRTGQAYARLQYHAGPQKRTILPVRIDWAAWAQLRMDSREMLGSPQQDWMNQYLQHVRVESAFALPEPNPGETPTMARKSRAARLLPLLVPIAPIAVD
jgi:hypothetical protein